MASRRRPPQGDPAVIAMLEELLSDARAGRITDVLAVWVDPEREGWWRFYAGDVDNLIFEGRVATAEIRTRHPPKKRAQ